MSTSTNPNDRVTSMNQEKEEREREVKQLVKELTNNDITWDGQDIGIVAILKSNRAKRLVEIGEPAIPELIAAMSDESKFAVAHVILTYISKVEFTTIPWNGLEVNLSFDGRTLFNPDQRFDLVKRWHQWYRSTPRPNTLP
ncbi:MAG TPA: hypothetical protein DEA78_07185 [Cyanobacteria bacterium UBA11159]|nr:hypothetical protein [Cyanobacteria bacterium UBA11159]